LLTSNGAAADPDTPKTDKPASAQAMDHAQHGQMDHGKTSPAKGNAAFIKLDANKDGKLSKAEMTKDSKAAHFAMLDADKDGTLSPAEFAKASSM
jgi:hypothetical protein